MGIDGDMVGLRNRDGMDGSTMTLLAGRAVLDTVMVDGHAGWKGVLLAALDEDTVVLLDGTDGSTCESQTAGIILLQEIKVRS